jgi:hypothetical protein
MNALEALVGIILLATLVEFVVARIKAILPWKTIGTFELAPLYAAIIGIVVAIVAKVDILAMLGFASQPVVGEIITGLVMSGGSTAVHELIAKLRESRLAKTTTTVETVSKSGIEGTANMTTDTSAIISNDANVNQPPA